jgi:hypothetical protein
VFSQKFDRQEKIENIIENLTGRFTDSWISTCATISDRFLFVLFHLIQVTLRTSPTIFRFGDIPGAHERSGTQKVAFYG